MALPPGLSVTFLKCFALFRAVASFLGSGENDLCYKDSFLHLHARPPLDRGFPRTGTGATETLGRNLLIPTGAGLLRNVGQKEKWGIGLIHCGQIHGIWPRCSATQSGTSSPPSAVTRLLSRSLRARAQWFHEVDGSLSPTLGPPEPALPWKHVAPAFRHAVPSRGSLAGLSCHEIPLQPPRFIR